MWGDLMGLNDKQKELCDTLEGFVVVDAGPGTGKTHSIVQRYVNILDKGVEPMKILMLTFTRNAAEEMETRISKKLSKLILTKGADPNGYFSGALNNLKISTIDSLCLDIVLNSPDIIRNFFDPDDKEMMLSRSAALSENETLNRQYFAEFYTRFMGEHGSEYMIDGIDYAAIIGEEYMDAYGLIQNLMSRGIIPKKEGWYGFYKDVASNERDNILVGDRQDVIKSMKDHMDLVRAKLNGIKGDDYYTLPQSLIGAKTVPDDILYEIAYDDRKGLLEIVHDIYYNYITYCIRENRLTFGLCELFALIILLKDRNSRSMHSVDYLTIDEFQDTNELQLKICLLLLNQPNMCAVGDWKQGIFGFRYVSVENIMHFEDRVNGFLQELEDNGIMIPFDEKEFHVIEFDENYRSTQDILDMGFDALKIKGSSKDVIEPYKAKELTAKKNDRYEGINGINWILAETKDEEVTKVVDMITQYVCSGDYKVIQEKDDDTYFTRNAEFGDIGVLCRSSVYCNMIFKECERRHIPAYLQGDLEVMSLEEGKLVLAWLRYLNNESDRRGLTTILDHLDYPPSEIETIIKNRELVPDNIRGQLSNLRKKKRRINDLITSILDFYGMNGGVAQTIINVISSAHKGSLMTISDVIRLIEDDIAASTRYNVEPLIDRKAVTIQTIHKSKGLEYPIVIIPGIISSSFPSTKQNTSSLTFDDKLGVRCGKTYIKNENGGDHAMVVDSWKTKLAKAAYPIDYSEERRLLFVAVTRAKQYLAITSYNQRYLSPFFKAYKERENCIEIDPKPYDVLESMSSSRTKPPVIGDYKRRRMSISVHDLMTVIKERDDCKSKEGKGEIFGDKIHSMAYRYLTSNVREDINDEDEDVPIVMGRVAGIIDSLSGAKLSGEIKCILPVGDVSIKGTMDLLAEFDDRFEIHDYKTDMDERNIERYRLQVSIYAHVLKPLGKDVKCYLDFVSLDKKIPVEPYPMSYIEECIAEYKRQSKLPI